MVTGLFMPKKLLILSFFLTLLLSACGVSLAGDVTPPPNYQSPTPPQTAPVSVAVQPLLPPDPVQGAASYAEKCLPCHGEKGLGDGPQAAKLGLPIPAIGSTTLGRTARPADWYNIVTNGKMENGMPPFKSLNDRQRWDVIAYVLTLSTTPDSLQQGKQIYDQTCSSCHGPTGRGDGSANISDWSAPGKLDQRSANDLVQVINTGVAPSMPAYASQYSPDQIWALADYIRTFSFASSSSSQTAASGATPDTSAQSATSAATAGPSAQSATPAATADTAAQSTPAATAVTAAQSTSPAATAAVAALGNPDATQGTPSGQATLAPFTVSITGTVTGTTGGGLPTGLKVSLQGYDNMSPTWSNTADVQADGSYRFDSVEVVSGRTFLATVTYQNVPFDSAPLHAADLTAGQVASLPITLTDVTSDASGLSVQRMHVFFDFSEPGMVQVAELFIVTNPGTKAVVPTDSKTPVVEFSIPQGAENLSFQDGALGGRYVQITQGFGDLTPIHPNEQVQVLFGYTMTYAGTQSLSIPVTIPVESAVVMVPSGGVSLTSAQLVAAGQRDVSGTSIQLFTANSLAKGSTLDMTLTGLPSGNVPAGTPGALGGTNEMVIGIGVFGVVLIAAGVWLYRQRRRNNLVAVMEGEEELAMSDEVVDSPEALLDAIVALDDLYQAGELPETAYQQRRADLKERLRKSREG